MATPNLSLNGGDWFEKNFYDLLSENKTGDIPKDKLDEAIKRSSWYGKISDGSGNPYTAAREALSLVGQDISNNFNPPVSAGDPAAAKQAYMDRQEAFWGRGAEGHAQSAREQTASRLWSGAQNPTDATFFPELTRLLQKNLPAGKYTPEQISDAMKASGWWGQLGSGSNPYGAMGEVVSRLGEDTSFIDPAENDRYRQDAESKSPEGIARINKEKNKSLFGDLSLPLQIGASYFGGPIGAGAFSLVNSGGDIGSAVKAGALTYGAQELFSAFGGGSTPSITDELSFTGGDYWNGAGMSAADQIATGQQFANNVVPGSVSTDTPIDNFTPSITDELSFADSNYWTNPINSMSGPTEYGGGGGYGTSVGAPESIGGGAFGPGSIAAAAGAGTAGSWSALAKEALGYAGPAMAIGSALYGFDKAGDLRDSVAGARASMAGAVAPIPGQPSVAEATAKAQSLANPWQTSGGTDLATTQLKNFMQSPDPSMQVGKPELDPAFAARIQGAQRATANYGQDSGNMAIAGANASSTWYNERLQQLANLAGAPGNPVGAAQIGLQGQALGQAQQQLQLQAATGGASNSLAANQAANDLVSRSLASGAYGATRLAGGSTQFTPAMLEALRKAGITFTGMPS